MISGNDNSIFYNIKINIAEYDYVTIWMNTIDDKNSTAWNQWYQGDMLNYCKIFRKVPLFYAYVIAFEARAMLGYQDCDVHPTNNLCHKGSNFIRNNRNHILSKYNEHALNIAYTYGTTDPVIFDIEPDFWYGIRENSSSFYCYSIIFFNII